jgi:hypothetical protein
MKPRHTAGAFHSAEERASLADLPAPGGGDLHSNVHFRSADDVLLSSRQQAVDRQLGKHVIREVVCEHECLGAAVRAAGQNAERPPLLVGQLRHCLGPPSPACLFLLAKHKWLINEAAEATLQLP